MKAHAGADPEGRTIYVVRFQDGSLATSRGGRTDRFEDARLFFSIESARRHVNYHVRAQVRHKHPVPWEVVGYELKWAEWTRVDPETGFKVPPCDCGGC